MSGAQLEIQGMDAVLATEELLGLEGLEGSWEPASSDTQRELTLATVATIVTISVGGIAIAEKLYGWIQKLKNSSSSNQIDKVILIGRNGNRILLKNASVEQIKRILES